MTRTTTACQKSCFKTKHILIMDCLHLAAEARSCFKTLWLAKKGSLN